MCNYDRMKWASTILRVYFIIAWFFMFSEESPPCACYDQKLCLLWHAVSNFFFFTLFCGKLFCADTGKLAHHNMVSVAK